MAPPTVPESDPKTLSTDANLARLLPTGTVLAFLTFLPLFTNNGKCLIAHKYLTLSLILLCSLSCFLFSFNDSFMGRNCKGKEKLYYGIATFNGIYIFNKDEDDDDVDNGKKEIKHEECLAALAKYKITLIDFVHAFLSLMVFLVFAISSSDVQSCFFPGAGANINALIMNLPLGVGALVSFLFTIFPTTRRGIGFTQQDLRKQTTTSSI